MLLERMVERCPSARKLSVAKLTEHSLCFDKRSWRDGSGKCRVARNGVADTRSEAVVWGVLYDIAESDREHLDRIEGVGCGYRISHRRLELPDKTRAIGLVYEATPEFIDAAVKPFSWYRDLVLAGAFENDFPEIYISQIRAVETVADLDMVRAAAAQCLIRKSM